jgi:acid phosphatase type 7
VTAWFPHSPSRVVAAPPAAPLVTDFAVVVADMQPASGANVPPQVVSAQIRALSPAPGIILMPGDIANDGTASEYTIWDGYYGADKTFIYPVPGNHDHAANGDPANTPTNLVAYDAYFGAQGDPGTTPPHFISFDTPAGWHVLGFDSGEQWIGSLANPSATYTAVANDLAANAGKPVIAFWHHPRWSDGTNTADPGGTGDSAVTQDIWNLLYDNHADLVFTGHCHSYQRFPKFGKTGTADSAGIREFVVGTGGSGLFTLTGPGRSEVNSYQSAAYDQVNSKWFGYLKLWLTSSPHSYSWQFISQNAAGSQAPGAVLDSGGPVASNQP